MGEYGIPLEPGDIVRHPTMPGWGLGQVQSSVSGRVTVAFENAGKVVVDARRVALVIENDTIVPK